MTGRNGHVDSHSELVSLFMGVIGLLNGNVAPADVIAEFVQALGFLQHHLFDVEGFFQATIRDFYWQLHSSSIVMPAGSPRQALSLLDSIHRPVSGTLSKCPHPSLSPPGSRNRLVESDA